MRSRKTKAIPEFSSEEEERAFWANHDSVEYLDWAQSRPSAFPKLRPTLQTISIRLPVHMLNDIKTLASKRDVAYQSLMKTMLAESVKREFSIK